MNAFEKVEAIRKKDPSLTLLRSFRAAKVSSASYYKFKKQKTSKKARRSSPRYEQIEAQPTTNKIPVIFCTPDQIKELFN